MDNTNKEVSTNNMCDEGRELNADVGVKPYGCYRFEEHVKKCKSCSAAMNLPFMAEVKQTWRGAKVCFWCHKYIDGMPFVGPANKRPYCNKKCAIEHQHDFNMQMDIERSGNGEYW